MQYKSFKNFKKIFETYGNLLGKSLLVLDIDNTIFKTPTDIGSDQWFDWQLSILGKNKDSSDSFQNILKIYNNIHKDIELLPCEEDIPSIIKKFKNNGFNIILLTARNNETFDNLRKNLIKYELWDCLYKEVLEYQFDNCTINHNQKGCYKDGLIMAAGLNKASLLKQYLNKQDIIYDNIIFVDDKLSNISSMSILEYVNLILYTNQHSIINNFKIKMQKMSLK